MAVISAFIVPIDAQYISYINLRVLVLLFALMSVMGGLQSLGIFEKLSYALLKYVKSTRSLTLLLVSIPILLIWDKTTLKKCGLQSAFDIYLILRVYRKIASLASLISYKYFVVHARKLPKKLGITKGKYMIHFTVMNLLFAIVLLIFNFIF